MPITIRLTPEVEMRLRRLADGRRQPMSALAREMLSRGLEALEPELAGAPPAERQDAADRAAAFRAWAACHRSGGPLLTDASISRESIYGDMR